MNGIVSALPVGGTPGSLSSVSLVLQETGESRYGFDAKNKKEKKKEENVQPVNHPIVGALEDKLVNHPVDAYRSADELELRVRRVAEDEMMAVEVCETLTADASSQRRDVVDLLPPFLSASLASF